MLRDGFPAFSGPHPPPWQSNSLPDSLPSLTELSGLHPAYPIGVVMAAWDPGSEMDTSLPSSLTLLEPQTKSWERGPLLFADKETEVQRIVTFFKVPQLFTVFQLQVSRSWRQSLGRQPVEPEEIRGRRWWVEVRGRFSVLLSPEKKQCQVRKWYRKGL